MEGYANNIDRILFGDDDTQKMVNCIKPLYNQTIILIAIIKILQPRIKKERAVNLTIEYNLSCYCNY